ncbi:MAG: AAA family ATPase [Oligoflexia bacterium]|nr:AAA family ATPase [Oligoflexia bacterium]
MPLHQDNIKRLYLFSGKGGVGKTTTSIAFANYLKLKKDQNVLYLTFDNTSAISQLMNDLNINYQELDFFDNVTKYIESKFNSLVAKTITHNSFFKATTNMVPGVQYIIHLGHIINELEKNPNIIAVFDAPSSGHLLVMLESLNTFGNIFKSGIIFNDILKVQNYLGDKSFSKINLCTLPSYMSVNEALDTKNKVTVLNSKSINTNIFINSSYLLMKEVKDIIQLPLFLADKIRIETEILNENKNHITTSFPFITETNYSDIINELTPLMGSLE